MILKLKKDKILKETGIKEMKGIDYLFYIIEEVDFLLSHNKNYTKKQEKILTDIKSILDNAEVVENKEDLK